MNFSTQNIMWKRLPKKKKNSTVVDNTSSYPLDPEASSAANLAEFSTGTFVNGLIFSVEDFGGSVDGGEASVVDSVRTGSGDVGEATG